jgi:type II secretory pathway pseudopilin PulG
MRIVAVIVIIILIGAALYWLGLSQGRSQLEAEKQNFSTQLQQMNTKAVSAEYNTRLSQARFLLCRTARDLDQRNFGLANTHLKETDAALGAINASMMGIDSAKFEALRKDIAGTNLNVAVNLEDQRRQVLDFSSRLEELLPRTTQAGATQAPASVAVPQAAAPPETPQTASPQATGPAK